MMRISLPGFALALLAAAAPFARAQTVTKIIDNGPDTMDRFVIAVLGDGYDANDQDKFKKDVDDMVINGVFTKDFFAETHNGFNVYRVDLVSNDSGVSHYSYDDKITRDRGDDVLNSQTDRDTALGIIFTGTWYRCWMEDGADTPTRIADALVNMPSPPDLILVILNEGGWGGCRNGNRMAVTRSVGWETVAHELGHGIGSLWDEYDKPGTFPDPVNGVNVSNELTLSQLFWGRFVGPATVVPTTGSDPNVVGMYVGGAGFANGVYRPTVRCRMDNNSPPFCVVCYTWLRRTLYKGAEHNFNDAFVGDFNGDKRSDVVLHNGHDLALYTSSGPGLAWTWSGNNRILPQNAGAADWQPGEADRILVTDFDDDGKDDLIVYNPINWVDKHLALLRSTGKGFECVRRYDKNIGGTFWPFSTDDRFMAADFNGDGKKDIVAFNGSNWAKGYLGLFRSAGDKLIPVARHDDSVPFGWRMRPHDQFFPGDFNGDKKTDFYVYNDVDSGPMLGMLSSQGNQFRAIHITRQLPNWDMRPRDQYFVGDINGDKRADLFVSSAKVGFGAPPSMLLLRSTGTDLAFVNRHTTFIPPAWHMAAGDEYFVTDVNGDNLADLLVYNPVNWTTQFLGLFFNDQGWGLRASGSADWIDNWDLKAGDKLLVGNFTGGSGKPDIFIRNTDFAGIIRRFAPGFHLLRIHFHWLMNPRFDSAPWSDSMP